MSQFTNNTIHNTSLLLCFDDNEFLIIPMTDCELRHPHEKDHTIYNGELSIHETKNIYSFPDGMNLNLVKDNKINKIKVTKKVDCFGKPIKTLFLNEDGKQSISTKEGKLIIRWETPY